MYLQPQYFLPEIKKDTETKARVQGVMAQMEKFDFFFGLSLGICILGHADSLSAAIQRKTLSACEAKKTANLTVNTLTSIRNDDSWSLFWVKTKAAAAQIPTVNSSKLPRKRRAPMRLEECVGGQAPPEYSKTEEAHYRRIYYECLDLVSTAITSRFNQPDYEIYVQCENLLLWSILGEDIEEPIRRVVKFFEGDFSIENLRRHLQVFAANFKAESSPPSIIDVFSYVEGLSAAKRALMSEVVKVVELLLVAPVTNATSERSFSILRLIKQYLRSTMTQARLNHLMTCSIYRERVDKLDLRKVANNFITGHDHRMDMFGLFK